MINSKCENFDKDKINYAIKNNKEHELIECAEYEHAKQVSEILADIRATNSKLVFVTGPSSSGKTTFSKRLEKNLNDSGGHAICISLDDYYFSTAQLEEMEGNDVDFESIDAIDVSLFCENMKGLFGTGEVLIPTFDFSNRRRADVGRQLKYAEDTIVFVEGIHAFNDKLCTGLDEIGTYRVFCNPDFGVVGQPQFLPHDLRFIRRLCRDFRTRGASTQYTFSLWDGVRVGEAENIFPYKDKADATFNSMLCYELNVLKSSALFLLSDIDEKSTHYDQACFYKSIVQELVEIDKSKVPTYSILREFIGM